MDFLQLCITGFISFGTLFLLAKLMGHKQIAQLDFLIISQESPSVLLQPKWRPN